MDNSRVALRSAIAVVHDHAKLSITYEASMEQERSFNVRRKVRM